MITVEIEDITLVVYTETLKAKYKEASDIILSSSAVRNAHVLLIQLCLPRFYGRSSSLLNNIVVFWPGFIAPENLILFSGP